MGYKPLDGIKVIELSTYVAAPACGRLLKDWGARVIKVESNKGDAWRTFGSTHNVIAKEDENPFFDIINSGKESIVLDLKSEEGKEILFKLLEDADVFLTNTRPQSLRKLGLDYESIKDRFPKLIYSTITGFGECGPDVNNPGFDVVAFWGKSGFLNDISIDTGSNYPMLSPTGVGDVACGTSLFGGVCAALFARQKTGRGDYITVSLFGGAIWIMGFMYLRAQERYGDPFPKTRQSSLPMTSPYRCKDGEWLLLSILEHERYFATLCRAMGLNDVAEDPRFATKFDAEKNKKELFGILEKRFAEEDCAYWRKVLTENDIVNDRLSHFKDVVTSEQAWANNYLTHAKFINGEECVMPCTSIRSQNMGVPDYSRGPLLGEDTRKVLAELGCDEKTIDALENTGAVSSHK
ncbi:MAG: CoA transferase [Synergistaceae bacterium]|nr:CoA transferase [Synergistaceae bacterium]